MTFRDRTTFVIGAGASAEFGLPVGSQLASDIKTITRVQTHRFRPTGLLDREMDEIVRDAFEGEVPRRHAYDALKAIHESIHTAVSIDALVDRFQDRHLSRVAKILIASQIMRAEAASTLSEPNAAAFVENPYTVVNGPYGPLKNPEHSWIGQFCRILMDNVRNPDDIGKEISIICFNYDRCIEFHLTKTIAAAYQIDRSKALEIVERIDMIHPYGSIGKLSLGEYDSAEDRVPFGYHINGAARVEDIADNIRTYTEQIADLGEVKRIHAAMECNVLVFLGFGFNNQNMNLLRVLPQARSPSRVYVSAKGFHRQVSNTMVSRIAGLYSASSRHDIGVKTAEGIEFGATATELFEVHSPNLSRFEIKRLRLETGDFTVSEYE